MRSGGLLLRVDLEKGQLSAGSGTAADIVVELSFVGVPEASPSL